MSIPNKPKKTYTEAGRGRKECPSCGIFVPSRSQICVCDFDFAAAMAERRCRQVERAKREREQRIAAMGASKKQAAPEIVSEDVVRLPIAPIVFGDADNEHVLIAAAGPCPVVLEDSTFEAVCEWVGKLEGRFPGHAVSVQALMLFVRRTFRYGSDEHDAIKRHLLSIATAAAA